MQLAQSLRLGKVAQEREPAAWGELDACRLAAAATFRRTLVDTRWVLTWEVIGGNISKMSRLVIKGSQGAHLLQGLVEIAGRIGLR